MAATELRVTPSKIAKAGLTAAYTTGVIAATSTYVVKNDGKTFFRFYKTGANACVVTFSAVGTIRGQKAADLTVNVPATTGDVFVGPFEPTLFNDGQGDMRFSLSEATAVFFMPVTML